MKCHSSEKVSFPVEIISYTGLEVLRGFIPQNHHHEVMLQWSELFFLEKSGEFCVLLCSGR